MCDILGGPVRQFKFSYIAETIAMSIETIAHSMNLRFDTKFTIHHDFNNFIEDFTDKIRVSSAIHKMPHQILYKNKIFWTFVQMIKSTIWQAIQDRVISGSIFGKTIIAKVQKKNATKACTFQAVFGKINIQRKKDHVQTHE